MVGWGGVGGGMQWDASGSNDRPGVSSVAKSQDQLMMHNIEKSDCLFTPLPRHVALFII